MGRLPDFEGCEVDRSLIKLTRAGDGLSEPMRLDPVALGYHDEVYLVVRGEVTQVNHRPVSRDEDDMLTRVHTVEAREIVLVGAGDVAGFLDKERARISRLKGDEGAVPLPGMDGGPAAVADVETNIFGGRSGEPDDEPEP